MFPLAIIGIAIVGFAIGRGKSLIKVGNSTHHVAPSHVGARFHSDACPRPRPRPPSAIDILHRAIRQRQVPDEWMICEAVTEACNKGHIVLADAILRASEQSILKIDPVEASPSEAPASPPLATDAPASVPEEPPMPEPQSYPSPIEGVEDEDWTLFANTMKIHEPSFETDRHYGAFHQRKDRLVQLKLEAGKDETSQYQVFVSDCLDHLKHRKVVDEFVTSVVKVNGEDHVVTASGLLGLMKAAGPKNAIHWINNPDERSKFPRTTELFLRCNNCF